MSNLSLEDGMTIFKNLLLVSGYLTPKEEDRALADLDEMMIDDAYRAKCDFSHYNMNKFTNLRENNLSVVLTRMFNWERTLSGDQFWRNIRDRIREYERTRI